MIIEANFRDSGVRVTHQDASFILMREFIYKTPIEFRISYRQEAYSIFPTKGEKVDITLTDGTLVKGRVMMIKHDKHLTKITICHELLFDLMTNNIKSQYELLEEKMINYVSYDDDAFLNYREVLATKGLLLTIDENFQDIKKTHISEWESRERKVIRGVFRRVQIDVQQQINRYFLHNQNTNFKETPTGTSRSIHSYLFNEEEIDAINKTLIPIATLLCRGFNSHIKIMDKVKDGDTDFCIMGIQRGTIKKKEYFSYFTLGKIIE